jgi:toxin ParE1/3/4
VNLIFIFSILPAAQADLSNQADYYVREADVDTALRFLDAVERTFELLKSQPHMGAFTKLSHPVLEKSRFVAIKGFNRILVFYRVQEDRLDVIRVIHGYRDIPALL